ncbi:hypothetical protein BD779DRAFT_1471989 [Infundibulicybe gibba]|nr:hypothetical protein BD779DRAFT_1471989 [Infundibulicybe gibba]
MYHSVTSLLLLILPLAVATPAPRSLLRRATFDPNAVPAQCTSACNPLTATVVACDATNNVVACGLCTTKTEQEGLQCANCIVALNPTSDVVSDGQLDIDEYIDECSALGVVLPPVKVTVPKTASTSNANAALMHMGEPRVAEDRSHEGASNWSPAILRAPLPALDSARTEQARLLDTSGNNACLELKLLFGLPSLIMK